MKFVTCISFSCLCALAVGCSASSGAPLGQGGSGATGGTSSAGGSSGSGFGGSGFGGSGTGGSAGGISVGGGGGSGGSAQGQQVIYANTDTVLFKLNPQNFALTQIGTFDCVGGSGQDSAMTDLAVDKSLHLWGISQKAAHPLTVQGATVHCGTPINLNNPQGVSFYGLTFAPAGVLDPTKEVLIGSNSAGQLWEIDANGNLSQHGTFGMVPANDGNGHSYANAGKPWELSGDIVFLANNGSPIGFATVRDCPNPPSSYNCDKNDTLIQINVSALKTATTQSVTQAVRGEIVPGSNCSKATTGNLGSFYGIAALNDKVYAFARNGQVVLVNTTNGTACLVQDYSSDKWAGAGVTTLAPVKPPPVK